MVILMNILKLIKLFLIYGLITSCLFLSFESIFKDYFKEIYEKKYFPLVLFIVITLLILKLIM